MFDPSSTAQKFRPFYERPHFEVSLNSTISLTRFKPNESTFDTNLLLFGINQQSTTLPDAGMEVRLFSAPETIAPPNIHLEDKYCNPLREPEISTSEKPGFSDRSNLSQSIQPATLNRRVCGPITVSWLLAFIIVLSVGAALGGGLGGGLAAQHKFRYTVRVSKTSKGLDLSEVLILNNHSP